MEAVYLELGLNQDNDLRNEMVDAVVCQEVGMQCNEVEVEVKMNAV